MNPLIEAFGSWLIVVAGWHPSRARKLCDDLTVIEAGRAALPSWWMAL